MDVRPTTPTVPSLGLLILRLGMGGYMLTHGWGKFQMLLEKNFAMMGDPIGVGPVPSLVLLVFAEFVCAGLIVLGLATRLAVVPLIVAMGVAAFVAHGNDPWTMTYAATEFYAGRSQSWASKQPALMFLIPFLALVFTGPGRFSLDHLIWKRRKAGDASAV